jgi:hypothetical protein
MVNVETPPKMLHIRRDRFLTLLGSVIIFVTFVLQEGISENLRDLVSNVGTAENLFILRHDTVSRAANRISWPEEPEEDTPEDRINDIAA